MKRLRKFLRLHWKDQCLLIQSLFLVVGVRIGLWVLPFKTLRRLLIRMTQKDSMQVKRSDIPSDGEAAAVTITKIAWAVSVVSRYVPEATCFTQALAVQILLARRGHPGELRIGVARGEVGQFEAHAWVESQGRIIIGGSRDLSRYTPLPPLEGGGL